MARILATGNLAACDYSVNPPQVTMSTVFTEDSTSPTTGTVNAVFEVAALAATTTANYKQAVIDAINASLSTSYTVADLQLIGGVV